MLTAANGTAAAALFAQHAAEIAIVVTDRDMPSLDGAGLARLIHERASALKILLMSGAGSHPHEPTRLENFAAASLRKPFTSEALLTCVEQHLPARPRPTRSAAP